MKNRYLLIIPIIIFQILPIRIWNLCRSFSDIFHFSKLDLELQLNFAINQDYSLPIFIARAFHNKAFQGLIDIYFRYTRFIDLQLFFMSITVLGVFGFIVGIWYFSQSKIKNKLLIAILALAFVLPLIEVIFNPDIPFLVKYIVYFSPFQIISFYGHYQFIKRSRKIKLIVLYAALYLISLLWITNFSDLVYKFCAKI